MSLRLRALSLTLLGSVVVGCASPTPQATPTPPPPSATPSPTPAASAPATSPPAASASAEAPLVLAVEARDLSFTPRALTASTGAPVTLTIENDGRIVHNLTIDELGVQLVTSPGETRSTVLTDIPAGTYTFYCSVSGHRQAGMFGTLTVQ